MWFNVINLDVPRYDGESGLLLPELVVLVPIDYCDSSMCPFVPDEPIPYAVC